MGRVSKYHGWGGSKYDGEGARYTMGRVFIIPQGEFDIPCVGVRYTNGRGLKIPRVGSSKYHG